MTTDSWVAVILCGWIAFLGTVAVGAIRFVDRWIERHTWVDVDG